MERKESDDLSLLADHQPFFFCLHHPSHRHHFFPPINHAGRGDFSPSDFSQSLLFSTTCPFTPIPTLFPCLLPRPFQNRMGERERVRERETNEIPSCSIHPSFFYTASLSDHSIFSRACFRNRSTRASNRVSFSAFLIAADHPIHNLPPCISING